MGWITVTVGLVGALAGIALTGPVGAIAVNVIAAAVGGTAGTVIGATAEYTANSDSPKSKLVLHSHVHIVTLHR